jgi:hypothetical protein
MSQCVMSFLLATLLFWGGEPAQRGRPDFSGNWILADFRSATDPAPDKPGLTGQSGVVGGAVVNCGQVCTITQTPETLTVSRPVQKEGAKPPQDGVVYMDGRPKPANTTAIWEGEKLVLKRTIAPPLAVTQTFAREGDKLIMVVAIGANKVGPFTLTYTKK